MFLALAATTPQDSFDLRARYGEPEVERFTIRPDVTMTAEYGPDGKACVLTIKPRQEFLHELMMHSPTMTRETAMDVLDQVVPETRRGKDRQLHAAMQDGCGAIEFLDYENVSVSLGLDACASPSRVQNLSVQFKRSACPQWHPKELPHQETPK